MGGTLFDSKHTKAAQFDAMSIGHGVGNRVGHAIDDALHLLAIEMLVLIVEAVDKLGFDHRICRQG